jgi:MFS family permease
VTTFARLFRLIWGADVEPALRPLLAVSFVSSAAFSAGWSFVGIWAIEELGATSRQLGVAYLSAAVAGFAAGYLGGHLSDYLGRRPLILFGWALLALTFLLYTMVGHHVWLGLGLASLAGIGGSIDIAPSTWGFLVIINPALVTLFQLRVTRWTSGWPAGPKLATAMLLMGWSLLFLLVDGSVAMFLVVLFVFVVGEMLWVPTSQAIVARLAPEDLRGAYMGAFGSMSAVGFALGPFTGLQLRGAYGDDAAWYFFAAVSLVAAATGAAAVRGAAGRRVTPAPVGY